jgi:hypothetical protein
MPDRADSERSWTVTREIEANYYDLKAGGQSQREV